MPIILLTVRNKKKIVTPVNRILYRRISSTKYCFHKISNGVIYKKILEINLDFNKESKKKDNLIIENLQLRFEIIDLDVDHKTCTHILNGYTKRILFILWVLEEITLKDIIIYYYTINFKKFCQYFYNLCLFKIIKILFKCKTCSRKSKSFVFYEESLLEKLQKFCYFFHDPLNSVYEYQLSACTKNLDIIKKENLILFQKKDTLREQKKNLILKKRTVALNFLELTKKNSALEIRFKETYPEFYKNFCFIYLHFFLNEFNFKIFQKIFYLVVIIIITIITFFYLDRNYDLLQIVF